MGQLVRWRGAAAVCCLAGVALSGCTSSSKPADPTTYPPATAASTTSADSSSGSVTPPPASATGSGPTASGPSATAPTSKAPTSKAPTSASPKPSKTPTQVVPTVPKDVPTTGPNIAYKGEKPPVMPVAATKHTAEGAKAFAEFYLQTIDWGYATTSSAYMRHYFVKTCDVCLYMADDLDNTRAKRLHYLGDRFKLTGSSVQAINSAHETGYRTN